MSPSLQNLKKAPLAASPRFVLSKSKCLGVDARALFELAPFLCSPIDGLQLN